MCPSHALRPFVSVNDLSHDTVSGLEVALVYGGLVGQDECLKFPFVNWVLAPETSVFWILEQCRDNTLISRWGCGGGGAVPIFPEDVFGHLTHSASLYFSICPCWC